MRQSWYIVDDLLYYSQHFMEPDWIVMDSDRFFLHMGRSNTDPMNYFNLLGEEGAAKASLQKEDQHYVISVDTPYDNLMQKIERQPQFFLIFPTHHMRSVPSKQVSGSITILIFSKSPVLPLKLLSWIWMEILYSN